MARLAYIEKGSGNTEADEFLDEFAARTQSEAPKPLLPELPPAERLVAPGNFESATRLQP